MKSFWYIGSYDKVTGEEVETFTISPDVAKRALRAMGYTKYQDVYELTSPGFEVLQKERINLAPLKLDYQIEQCSD